MPKEQAPKHAWPGPVDEPGVASLRPALRHSIRALEDWSERLATMQGYIEIELAQLYLMQGADTQQQSRRSCELLLGKLHRIWADFEGGTDGLKLSVLRHLRDGIESAASAYGRSGEDT